MAKWVDTILRENTRIQYYIETKASHCILILNKTQVLIWNFAFILFPRLRYHIRKDFVFCMLGTFIINIWKNKSLIVTHLQCSKCVWWDISYFILVWIKNYQQCSAHPLTIHYNDISLFMAFHTKRSTQKCTTAQGCLLPLQCNRQLPYKVKIHSVMSAAISYTVQIFKSKRISDRNRTSFNSN